MNVCMYVYMYVCMHVCMHVCMYVCVCVCVDIALIYICTYTSNVYVRVRARFLFMNLANMTYALEDPKLLCSCEACCRPGSHLQERCTRCPGSKVLLEVFKAQILCRFSRKKVTHKKQDMFI